MREDAPPRCDGCGENDTTARVTHTDDDGTVLATYCPGCETLRQVRHLKPGEHDQHALAEAS
jgi:hypothetical protein